MKEENENDTIAGQSEDLAPMKHQFTARRLKKNENLQPFKLDIEQGDLHLSVVILGDRGVGKSCFIERTCQNTFETSPRVELCVTQPITFSRVRMEYQSPMITNNLMKQIRLTIFDTMKHEETDFQEFFQRWGILRHTEGYVLCFDVNNRDSFLHCEEWMKQIIISQLKSQKVAESKKKEGATIKESAQTNGETLDNNDDAQSTTLCCPMILLGLKVDKVNDSNTRVSFDEATAFATIHGLKYMECSSKDNIGVEEAIFTFINDIVHSSPHYKKTLTRVFTEAELQRQESEYRKNKLGHSVCRIW